MSSFGFAASADWRRVGRLLPATLVLLFAGLAFYAVRHALGEVEYSDVADAIRVTPLSSIGLAMLATAASYGALLGYDRSGLRFAGAQVAPAITALTSFCAYALGNTIGLGVLTGGAVRYRLYSAAGVEAGKIARAIAFMATAFGSGIAVVTAVALIWAAPHLESLIPLPASVLRLASAGVVAAAVLFLLLCSLRREWSLWGQWQVRLPAPGLVLMQLVYSIGDLVFASLVLWMLMPQAAIGYGDFLALYVIAIGLGVLSHLPGGIGVFEAVILIAYRDQAPVDAVAASLLLYRVVYHLLPLFVAIALLGINELRAAGAAKGVSRLAGRLSPLFVSALTLIVGIMLLMSGAIPATDAATDRLSEVIPLQLMEASYFLGSLAGLGLLFVARGLLHRLGAAWWFAFVLAVLSLLFALPKGLAVTEMIVLGFLILMLLVSRRQFQRRASLVSQAFTGGWLVTMLLSVGAMAWVFFFVYQDVEYTHQLWWQFEFDAHAPRGLRATTAVAITALALTLWQGFRPASGRVHRPTTEELARAAAIVAAQPRADAALALLGDKSFLFSESGKAFISFGKRGRTWAALFDPTGPVSEWGELIWDFVELAAEHGGRPCFYQVMPAQLSLFLDAGMHALKLGEYATVPLAEFGVQGPARAPLRHALNRGKRDGLTLEVLPPGSAHDLMPVLRSISDDWLQRHQAREKSFSMGSLQPDFLARFPIALLRCADTPVAFASLLVAGERREVCVDLMRYTSTAPRGAMDFLFVSLMLHFQSEGYTDFGLGMAPLSGLTAHPLASRWHRLGDLVFRHGEQFYNFQGLRAFKEKFSPRWEPRYLCAPGGVHPWLALADVAALSGGSLRGVFSK